MVLEAPVSGECHRTSTGNISILVGGKRIAVEKALPILKIIGFKIAKSIQGSTVIKFLSSIYAPFF